MNDTLGMIGLGNAGSALAGALAGRRALIGYDANPARRAAITALDMRWAASVAEVGEGADTVLLSLPKPEASRTVVAELVACARPPGLIVETSTITPKVARGLAEACAGVGTAFVDAAIAGGVQSMAAGSFDRCRRRSSRISR